MNSKPATPRCPICGKPSDPGTRPFCSARCAEIDLGRWLTGQYRLPGPPDESQEVSPPAEPAS